MDPIFSPEQLAEVKAYHAPRYVYVAVDMVLWPLLLVTVARYGTGPLYRGSQRLAAWCAQRGEKLAKAPVVRVLPRVAEKLWGGPGWGAAVLFALLLLLLFSLVDLPVDIYFGYVREHQYGLARMSAGVWAWDWVKTNVVVAVAISALAFGLLGLARRLPAWWWVMGLVASVVMMASAAIDPYRSRLYIDQTPLPAGELRTRITALMEKAHIDFRDVMVDKMSTRTVKLQAYFAGTGPTRTIVLNDSLISTLSTEEVLAAVAHEAGHVNESKWPNRIGSGLALLLLLFAIERLLRFTAKHRWLGITERADVRALPLILLLFDVSMMAAAPVGAALSRARETKADQYAVALTGDAGAFKSMLKKAALTNKMDPTPPRWYVIAGMTHPPIAERIAAVGEK